MPKTFYIIDGHAQIYRAYYAPFRGLSSPRGEPTKATYVFCSMLLGLIRDRKPDYLAMVMDVSDSTVFRCAFFPEYKAQRDPAPEDLAPQITRIVSLVQAMGIPILAREGFEADDLMATLAARFAGEDVHVHLVSKDKDLEQLLGARVWLFDPAKGDELGPEWLRREKGYSPEQAVEVQTLVGDNVDNIPGVPGIGPKTAAKLIAAYGTAENVLAHADELTPKQRDNVKAFAEQMPVTRRLVTLLRDVELDFELEQARFQGVPVERVRPLFLELGFNRLVEQLPAAPASSAPPAAPLAPAAPGPAKAAPQNLFELAEADAADRVAATPPPAGRYELVDTPAQLAELAAKLGAVDCFAFDTETTGLNPVAAELVGISLSWEAGVAYYVPLRARPGCPVVAADDVRRLLGPLFADPARRKVGQNLKYDVVALRQVGLEVAGLAFDTMVASFLLDPLARSHGIDALALEYFGHRKIATSELIGKGKNQVTMDTLDAARVAAYAGEDADFAWRLYEAMSPQIEDSTVRALFHDTEMPLVRVLADMEHAGVALDSARLARMSAELGERLDGLVDEIHAIAGHAFNIDSTQQLAQVLFDEQSLPVIKRTRTLRSTDAEVLEELAATTDNRIPRLMLEYRELSKLRSTYLDTLPQMVCPKTGRIHASFHQTGAVTGRLSSSDPNLQNIPIRTDIGARIREAFVAGDEDHVLLVADYSQIELRVLAHFSGDAALREAFASGLDIHASVAAQVNDVPLAEVTPAQRSAAKAVNFGIIYGQTAFGLSRSLGITKTAAQEFIDRYHARFPGIRRFIETCIADVRAKGYAETILGRRRPISELGSRNRQQAFLGERLAVNTVIQGSAADLIKRAMIRIHKSLEGGRYRTRLLIQVHDELVFEAPQVEVDVVGTMIRETMSTALPLDVPIVADMGVGRNWRDAKA